MSTGEARSTALAAALITGCAVFGFKSGLSIDWAANVAEGLRYAAPAAAAAALVTLFACAVFGGDR